MEDRSEVTVGSSCIGHTNRHDGYLTVGRCRSARSRRASGTMMIDVGPTPLRVAAKVDTGDKVAGALVLIFKEVVESRVSVGVPNGPSSTLSPITTSGVSNFALDTALTSTRAYVQSTRILTGVGLVTIR